MLVDALPMPIVARPFAAGNDERELSIRRL
jgi:hypothetical protein